MRRTAIACLLALSLGACGSSSSSSSTNAASPAADNGANQPPTAAELHARLVLARCMRAHGVDVPDSAAAGTPGSQVAVMALLAKYSLDQITAAANDCRSVLFQAFPQAKLSPAQQAQRRNQTLAYARCMRTHHIDVPDPQGTGLGFGIGMLKALTSVNLNSPAFRSANKACVQTALVAH